MLSIACGQVISGQSFIKYVPSNFDLMLGVNEGLIDCLSHSTYVVFFADIFSRNELRYILMQFFFSLCYSHISAGFGNKYSSHRIMKI